MVPAAQRKDVGGLGMERKLAVTQADMNTLLKEQPLMGLLTPLAQEQLKVIIMDRLLTEAESRQGLETAVGGNGLLAKDDVEEVMQKAWTRE